MNILFNIIIRRMLPIYYNYASYNEATPVLYTVSYILKLGTYITRLIARTYAYLILTNFYTWIWNMLCNLKNSEILVKSYRLTILNEIIINTVTFKIIRHMHYKLWFQLTNNLIIKSSLWFSKSMHQVFFISCEFWHNFVVAMLKFLNDLRTTNASVYTMQQPYHDTTMNIWYCIVEIEMWWNTHAFICSV